MELLVPTIAMLIGAILSFMGFDECKNASQTSNADDARNKFLSGIGFFLLAIAFILTGIFFVLISALLMK